MDVITLYFNAITRYSEFMEDSEIIYAVLELAPDTTKYNFLRIVYELEQHGKLIFMDEDQNQWSSGYIYYSPERNAIIIEYGESGRKMIEIPEGWEL